MKILRGKRAGFCMGVDLALKKLNDAIEKYPSKKIYTFGPIIHNPQVIEDYASKGVLPIEDISSVKEKDVVVIRAHGIPRDKYRELEERGAIIVDATCPKVKKTQHLIEKHSINRTLLLFGEKEHPEVKGLISYARGEKVVFSSLKELISTNLNNKKDYLLAAQTTQERKEFLEIIKYLKKEIGKEFPILNTICDATRLRQEEAISIARMCDVVIVIGGFNSGNTRRLVQVIKATGTKCYHIETIKDLPTHALKEKKIVGITAGASTPKYIIDNVEEYISSIS